MTIDAYRPKRGALLMLLPVAAAYLGWQWYLPWLSGRDWIDGAIGILLGLYICSRPAANGVDLFFAERGSLRRVFSRRTGVEWLVLNATVMLFGWLVLVAAASRLPGAGASLMSAP